MKLAKQHSSSGLNSSFNKNNLSFAAYIDAMRDIISQTRVDLENPQAQQIINANTPFELQPDKNAASKTNARKGILLIHGLYESPYHVRAIGQFFQKQGFLVRSILLPGHGTVPGDLLDVSYQAWLQACQFGIASFSDEVDELYLFGYSTGSTLALHEILDNPKIKAQFLFCPALQISRLAAILHWHHRIASYAPRVRYYHLDKDMDHTKYQSFTCNSVTQLYQLIKILKQRLTKQTITTPTFMVLSQADTVINSKTAIHLFQKLENSKNRLILYTSNQTKVCNNKNIICKNSYFPEENIMNISHNSLAIAPDDPYYGKQGEFTKLQQAKLHCKAHEIVYGEESMQTMVMRKYKHFLRLNYNPDFYNLLENMKSFIDQLD